MCAPLSIGRLLTDHNQQVHVQPMYKGILNYLRGLAAYLEIWVILFLKIGFRPCLGRVGKIDAKPDIWAKNKAIPKQLPSLRLVFFHQNH